MEKIESNNREICPSNHISKKINEELQTKLQKRTNFKQHCREIRREYIEYFSAFSLQDQSAKKLRKN